MNRALGSNRAEYSRRRDLIKMWKIFYVGGKLDRCKNIALEIDKFKTAPQIHKDLATWADEWDTNHSKENGNEV